MKKISRQSLSWVNRRWAVPVAIAALSATFLNVVPSMASADPQPNLPQLTADQLLTKAATPTFNGLSGNVKTVAGLGLPDLGNYMGGASSWTSFLTGTQHVDVWASNTGDARVRIPSESNETDLLKNSQGAWVWQSTNQHVIHAAAPNDNGKEAPKPDESSMQMLLPDSAAHLFLAAIQPTTAVSIDNTATVANHSAYQLVLTPNSSTTLVQDVRIAFDSKTFVPLRVQLFAKGQGSPAYEVAYTKVSLKNPNASVFSFSPPKGATVQTLDKSHNDTSHSDDVKQANDQPVVTGTAWNTVVVLPAQKQAAQDAKSQRNSTQGQMQELLKTAQPISGPFGSGKLLHTSLLNVAVLDDGRIAVGSVDQNTLIAAIPKS